MGKILSNIKVYDLEESLIASGYPHREKDKEPDGAPEQTKKGLSAQNTAKRRTRAA